MSAGPLPVGPEPAPDHWPDSPFTYVVGFNPMPMANAVATLGSTLRRSILWTLLGAVVWTAIWWTQRDSWGTPWLLVAGYGVSLVLILVTAAFLMNLGKWGIARQRGHSDDIADGADGAKRSGVAVILVGAVAMSLALIAVLFLREIPLQTGGPPTPVREGAAAVGA